MIVKTQTDLLRWWDDSARDLPWRDVRDPWLIHVSEVMSQQTQIDRVIPKWHAFIDRFPTPASAAEAAPGDVIAMWDGLGYNRRALLLHRCAVVVTSEYGGKFPEDLDSLLSLPGVGPYTARAILAFAFEHDVAVVDTNVGRVLARLNGSSFRPTEAQQAADALVPAHGGWRWNQAILDFGAQVCTKRSPGCHDCPLLQCCAWRGHGLDPAVGSASVSVPQSRFEGSDRQGRGRLVKALRNGGLSTDEAFEIFGFGDDDERSRRVLHGLIRDGMVVERDGGVGLP